MMKGMKPPADNHKKATLKCEQCGATQDVPMHCGRQMTVKKVGKKDQLVCWMGPECGKAEIPTHHGKPMKIV